MSGDFAAVKEVSPGYGLRAARSDLSSGYKQTQVGLIPQDWSVVTIGDLNPFVTSGSRGWARYYSKFGSLFIRITNMDRNKTRLDLSDVRYVRIPENEHEGTRTSVIAGDVLISITADIGIISYADDSVPLPAYINQHIALVRFDSESILPKYAALFLAVGNGQKRFKEITDQGAKAGINLRTVRDLPLAIPPSLDEQRAITTALSDVDALLEELDRLIAKKRDLKQATMQQLLTGQTRLPGFEGEWVTRKLSSIADIRSGGTPSTSVSAFWSGNIPWCTPTDITALNGKKYLSDTERTISHAGLKSSSAELIPAGSIIMTTRATIGECAINLVPMTTNQGFKNLIPSSINGEFLYYLMTMQKARLIQLCAGSTFLEIGKKQLDGFELIIPKDQNEQEAIAVVLSEMDKDIQILERRRSKTAALKQGMMQELLTGRTRLAEVASQDKSDSDNKTDRPAANVYFMRSVLAAEIVDQLHQEPTFGHVKFQKMLFLVEHLCDVDTGANYHRQAAGPYDNRALRSIDSQLRKQQWFDARKEGGRYHYVSLDKTGGHKSYFERYYAGIKARFSEVIETFRNLDTERCEIVATLFSAWDDLLKEKEAVSDAMIVHEVLNHWHESKRRIPEDRWLGALGWMREKGFVPKGAV